MISRGHADIKRGLMSSDTAPVGVAGSWMPLFVPDVPRVAVAPPVGLEPATYCLEGIRSFLNRNRGYSYLVGDCLRQQADAQQSHRLKQLPKSCSIAPVGVSIQQPGWHFGWWTASD